VSQYDGLSKSQLVALLEKHDRTKKLGLVWERDEILADNAIDENFVAATLDVDLSDKPAPWRNLVIEGDNFDSLRWLRMTYAGQIKCIYVDPPYNTGNKDWVYNDRYFDADDRYRFSTWLEFLHRRFTLARDLLTEDGVILISINDENRALLELMLEEALPGMRVGSFTWRSRTGGNEGGDHFFSTNHEHVLVYGMKKFQFSGTEKTFEKYKDYDPIKKDYFRGDNFTQPKDRTERENGYYAINDPKTEIYYPPNPNRVWLSPLPKGQDKLLEGIVWKSFPTWPLPRDVVRPKKLKDRIAKWVDEGRILFPEDQVVKVWNSLEELLLDIDLGNVPKVKGVNKIFRDMPNLEFWVGKKVGFKTPEWKRYKSDLKNPTQPISSWVTPKSEAKSLPKNTDTAANFISGTTQEGSSEVTKIFSDKVFNYPKPTSLLKSILKQVSFSGDIILDFFAGTATTAHAVMELNAEDKSSRRFIMASSTEVTEDAPDKNICRDITAERIRLLNKSDDKKFEELAADFAYLKTREIPFEAFDDELSPQEVWTALEALHGLPLTEFETGASWNEHAIDSQVIIYADDINKHLITHIKKHVDARSNLFVYSWAPGQIEIEFPKRDFEVRSVRDTLIRRFQQ